MTDPYESPEDYGLEFIGEVSWNDDAYSYDLTAVFRDIKTEKIYYANDSGCSCPQPFEVLHIDDLVAVTPSELAEYLFERSNETNSEPWQYVNLDDLTASIRDILEDVF